MRVLINNTVKTDTSDYTFNTREEAEAFYMTLKTEEDRRERPAAQPPAEAAATPAPRKGRKGATRH